MSDVRIIKRYANRKLYDTQHSRYVTLEQISEMIRNGDDVKIIDNKSKEDLTSVTLAQIIFEEEKKQRSFLPLTAMRNIIQNGGESFSQFLIEAQRRVTEAQRKVTSILPRRKEGEEGDDEFDGQSELHGAEPGVEVEDEGAPRKPRDGLGSLGEFREWLQQSQQTIEEWQQRMDGRIRNMVEGITPFGGLQKELKTLRARIGELEAKLAAAAARHSEAQAGEGAETASASSADHPPIEQAVDAPSPPGGNEA